MKRVICIAFMASVIVSLFSCGESSNRKVSSQGAAYELFVVCDAAKWTAAVGDTLRSILLEPVEMINQKEPMFDVLRIQPQAFDGLVTKHRNILIVRTGAEYAEPSMTAQYDVYAAPQIIVTLSGPDDAAITAYMWEHRSELQQIFGITERDRTLAYNAKYGEKHIEKEILKKFGFEIALPRGYKIRSDKSDFMWISYELPQASQGVAIFSYPYNGKSDFEAAQQLAARNKYTAMIPGPAAGSFMTTSDVFEPEVSYVRINGRFWSMMRGFWDVKGDYMGGPFVGYSTLDVATNRVVTIDCYLYSPKLNKRNLLRELEALIYSVKFPSDAEQTAGKAK